MIESIDNGIQITVLVVCVIAAIFKAARHRSRSWTLLTFFYASWLLGDIYWTVCLLFYDKTPEISVVSDLSWYASYIFLYLQVVLGPGTQLRRNSPHHHTHLLSLWELRRQLLD